MGCCCCRPIESEEEDITLRFRGLAVNYGGRKFLPNVIKTRTYNWISFPFIVLLLQFKPFFSQFFTAVALLQIFRALKVGLAFTYYLPLIFIFLVSIGRELYTELGCYKRDKIANSMLYQILSDSGIRTVRSDELQVGDIIYLAPGQNIPADILILHGTEPLYLKTTNLDGETDYKSRTACFDTTDIYSTDYKDILRKKLDSHILQYEPPSSQLYKFNGKFVLLSAPQDVSMSPVMPISLANTAWMNCTLAKGSVTGLVIYTGKQVRIMLGRKKPKSKSGKIDVDINLYVKGLFVLCIFLAFVLTMAGSVYSLVTFIRWIIILNAIIPLAMKVSLEYGKFTMAGTISYDPEIPGVRVQNSNLVEELGLINHIFSDKTGTLTKNDMWLHEVVGSNKNVTDGCEAMLHALMTCHNVELVTGRCRSIKITAKNGIVQHNDQDSEEDQAKQLVPQKTNTRIVLEKEKVIEGFGETVSLCFTEHTTNEYLLLNNYIGASPDEVAIIRGMHARGHILKEKTHNRIQYSSGTEDYEFELIHVFPFTSETRRMSVIVRNRETQVVYLFVKGADTAIEVISKPCDWMRNVVDQLATTGRRTLVYAYRILSADDLDAFQRAWMSAAEDINSRQDKLDQAEEDLLVNLDVLCVTGIEDQLQDNVKDTIQSLKRAGIKFWMLTGDKIITSLSIAQACGILPNDVISKHTDFCSRVSEIGNSTSRCVELDAQTGDVQHSLHIVGENTSSSAMQLASVASNPITMSPLDPVLITTTCTQERSHSCSSPKSGLRSPLYHRTNRALLRHPLKKSGLRNKKLANIKESAYVRKSQGVFFLTEELSLDRLLQTLHDVLAVVETQKNIAIIIDGGAIDALLGTYPTNYFYRYRIHPITGSLLPLPLILKAWRYFVRFLYVYFTGKAKSGKGSLGPDAKIRELFAEVTCRAETVICCRCTPGQKALVSEIITTYSGKQSLGIGDGANDVPLIQLCAVGVGIAGKEGTQAANSADFVINEFQGLKKLLLWHGRNSYIGSAQMCQFIMQRGITQTLLQIWFSMLYYFVTLVIYTGVLLLGFATFFTMLPPFNYYINEDIDYKLVMQYPEVYRYTSSGRLISFKTFCLWLLASIVISFMIFVSLVCVLPWDVIYTEFVLVSFAALLINQLLLISFTSHRWSVLLVITLVGSYASFYIVQTIYPDIFPLSFLYSFSFTWSSLYIAFSAALPIYIGSLLVKHLSVPPVIKKLRKLRAPADCACCAKKSNCACTKSPIHYYSSTGTYYFNLTDKAANVLTCRYCSTCPRKC